MSILLIPARTDTKWFRKLYDSKCIIGLIQGRLKFNDSNSAPFPSMLVKLCRSIKETSIFLMTKEEFEELYDTRS